MAHHRQRLIRLDFDHVDRFCLTVDMAGEFLGLFLRIFIFLLEDDWVRLQTTLPAKELFPNWKNS